MNTVRRRLNRVVPIVAVALALGAGAPGHASVVADGSPLHYGVTHATVSGPPYAAAPIGFEVFYPPDPIAPLDPVHLLEIRLYDVTFPPDPISPIPLTMNALGAGAAPGTLGKAEVVSDFAAGEPFPATLSFDLLISVLDHPGGAHPVLGIAPCSHPGDGTFFEVCLDVEVNSFAAHVMRFDAPAGLSLAEPAIGAMERNQFRLLFDLVHDGGGAPSALFTIEMSGEFVMDVLEPATAALLALGLAGLGVGTRRRRRR